jgi:hypothetical protein
MQSLCRTQQSPEEFHRFHDQMMASVAVRPRELCAEKMDVQFMTRNGEWCRASAPSRNGQIWSSPATPDNPQERNRESSSECHGNNFVIPGLRECACDGLWSPCIHIHFPFQERALQNCLDRARDWSSGVLRQCWSWNSWHGPRPCQKWTNPIHFIEWHVEKVGRQFLCSPNVWICQWLHCDVYGWRLWAHVIDLIVSPVQEWPRTTYNGCTRGQIETADGPICWTDRWAMFHNSLVVHCPWSLQWETDCLVTSAKAHCRTDGWEIKRVDRLNCTGERECVPCWWLCPSWSYKENWWQGFVNVVLVTLVITFKVKHVVDDANVMRIWE